MADINKVKNAFVVGLSSGPFPLGYMSSDKLKPMTTLRLRQIDTTGRIKSEYRCEYLKELLPIIFNRSVTSYNNDTLDKMILFEDNRIVGSNNNEAFVLTGYVGGIEVISTGEVNKITSEVVVEQTEDMNRYIESYEVSHIKSEGFKGKVSLDRIVINEYKADTDKTIKLVIVPEVGIERNNKVGIISDGATITYGLNEYITSDGLIIRADGKEVTEESLTGIKYLMGNCLLSKQYFKSMDSTIDINLCNYFNGIFIGQTTQGQVESSDGYYTIVGIKYIRVSKDELIGKINITNQDNKDMSVVYYVNTSANKYIDLTHGMDLSKSLTEYTNRFIEDRQNKINSLQETLDGYNGQTEYDSIDYTYTQAENFRVTSKDSHDTYLGFLNGHYTNKNYLENTSDLLNSLIEYYKSLHNCYEWESLYSNTHTVEMDIIRNIEVYIERAMYVIRLLKTINQSEETRQSLIEYLDESIGRIINIDTGLSLGLLAMNHPYEEYRTYKNHGDELETYTSSCDTTVRIIEFNRNYCTKMQENYQNEINRLNHSDQITGLRTTVFSDRAILNEFKVDTEAIINSLQGKISFERNRTETSQVFGTIDEEDIYEKLFNRITLTNMISDYSITGEITNQGTHNENLYGEGVKVLPSVNGGSIVYKYRLGAVLKCEEDIQLTAGDRLQLIIKE